MAIQHTPLYFNARTRGQNPAAPVRFGGALMDALAVQNAGDTVDQIGHTFTIIKHTFFAVTGTAAMGLGYFLTIHQKLLKNKRDVMATTYKQDAKDASPERHRELVTGLVNHKNHYVQEYAAKIIPALPDTVADLEQKTAWLKKLVAEKSGMAPREAKKSLKILGTNH